MTLYREKEAKFLQEFSWEVRIEDVSEVRHSLLG